MMETGPGDKRGTQVFGAVPTLVQFRRRSITISGFKPHWKLRAVPLVICWLHFTNRS